MNGTRYIFLVAKRRVSVYATLCLPFCLQFQFSLLSTYHDRLSKRLRVLRVLIVKFMGTKRKILVALPYQVINSIEYTFKVTSRKWRKNVNKYLWIIRRALYEEFYIYIYIYRIDEWKSISWRISSFRWNLNSLRVLWGRNSMGKKILDSNKTAIDSLIGIAARIS